MPVRHRVAHGVEEVVRAAVADELEPLLEIGRQLLVLAKRTKMALEAARTLEVEQRARVVHDGGDLRAAPDHPFVLRDFVDLAVAHTCDTFDPEPVERGFDPRPLRVDDAPADAGLKDASR